MYISRASGVESYLWQWLQLPEKLCIDNDNAEAKSRSPLPIEWMKDFFFYSMALTALERLSGLLDPNTFFSFMLWARSLSAMSMSCNSCQRSWKIYGSNTPGRVWLLFILQSLKIKEKQPKKHIANLYVMCVLSKVLETGSFCYFATTEGFTDTYKPQCNHLKKLKLFHYKYFLHTDNRQVYHFARASKEH